MITLPLNKATVFEKATKLGNKIPRELYIRHAILQRAKFTVTSNNRVVKNNVEYEIMKEGELRTFPMGIQGECRKRNASKYSQTNLDLLNTELKLHNSFENATGKSAKNILISQLAKHYIIGSMMIN